MGSIGNLFIAGKEKIHYKFKSGISFNLNNKSPLDYCYQECDQEWQVEFSQNSKQVVFRTPELLTFERNLSTGFSCIQRALDILAVKNLASLTLDFPSRNYIGIYSESGKLIMFVYELCEFAFELDINPIPSHFDAHSNKISAPLITEILWQESFRYYRLSHDASNVFDAYRNIFLAFEALLNKFFQKQPREGEKVWLRRALNEVSEKTDLTYLKGKREEPSVDYIIRFHYEEIRCRLQHAKFPLAILPHEDLSPTNVEFAYEEMKRIWRQIAAFYFNIPTNGAWMTNYAYETLMNNLFSMERLKICYTSDATPATGNDTSMSPGGQPVYEFQGSSYQGSVQPGIVRFLAREKVIQSNPNYLYPIHRFGIMDVDRLYAVSDFLPGILIDGVDEFEYIADYKLLNNVRNKSRFGG